MKKASICSIQLLRKERTFSYNGHLKLEENILDQFIGKLVQYHSVYGTFYLIQRKKCTKV